MKQASYKNLVKSQHVIFKIPCDVLCQ